MQEPRLIEEQWIEFNGASDRVFIRLAPIGSDGVASFHLVEVDAVGEITVRPGFSVPAARLREALDFAER